MDQTNDILARELSNLGGASAGWVARLLPNNEYELTTDVDVSERVILDSAERLLAAEGTLCPDITEAIGTPSVAAIVGSGALDLNPTIVAVEVSSLGENRCRVRVLGIAKEGLIKQRGAEKAVKRFADQLLAGSA